VAIRKADFSEADIKDVIVDFSIFNAPFCVIIHGLGERRFTT